MAVKVDLDTSAARQSADALRTSAQQVTVQIKTLQETIGSLTASMTSVASQFAGAAASLVSMGKASADSAAGVSKFRQELAQLGKDTASGNAQVNKIVRNMESLNPASQAGARSLAAFTAANTRAGRVLTDSARSFDNLNRAYASGVISSTEYGTKYDALQDKLKAGIKNYNEQEKASLAASAAQEEYTERVGNLAAGVGNIDPKVNKLTQSLLDQDKIVRSAAEEQKRLMASSNDPGDRLAAKTAGTLASTIRSGVGVGQSDPEITASIKNVNQGYVEQSAALAKADASAANYAARMDEFKSSLSTAAPLVKNLTLGLLSDDTQTKASAQSYKSLVGSMDLAGKSAALTTDAQVKLGRAYAGGVVPSIKEVNAAQTELTKRFSESNLKNSGNEAGSFADKFSGLNKALVVALGPLSGVGSRLIALEYLFRENATSMAVFAIGLVGFAGAFVKAVEAGSAFQENNLQLQGMLKATGDRVGYTAEQINSFDEALAGASGNSLAGIREASNELLVFQNVSGTAFKRALEVATDLSSVGIGNLVTNTRLLGRALNDPVTNLQGLSRAVGSFSGADKEMIKNLYETGQVAAADNIILERLEARVSGASFAKASGFAGALTELRNETTKFFEEVSNKSNLLQTLTDLVNSVSASFNTLANGYGAAASLGETFNAIAKIVSFTIQEIAAHLNVVVDVIVFAFVGKALNLAISAITTLTISASALITRMLAVTAATTEATAATEAYAAAADSAAVAEDAEAAAGAVASVGTAAAGVGVEAGGLLGLLSAASGAAPVILVLSAIAGAIYGISSSSKAASPEVDALADKIKKFQELSVSPSSTASQGKALENEIQSKIDAAKAKLAEAQREATAEIAHPVVIPGFGAENQFGPTLDIIKSAETELDQLYTDYRKVAEMIDNTTISPTINFDVLKDNYEQLLEKVVPSIKEITDQTTNLKVAAEIGTPENIAKYAADMGISVAEATKQLQLFTETAKNKDTENTFEKDIRGADDARNKINAATKAINEYGYAKFKTTAGTDAATEIRDKNLLNGPGGSATGPNSAAEIGAIQAQYGAQAFQGFVHSVQELTDKALPMNKALHDQKDELTTLNDAMRNSAAVANAMGISQAQLGEYVNRTRLQILAFHTVQDPMDKFTSDLANNVQKLQSSNTSTNLLGSAGQTFDANQRAIESVMKSGLGDGSAKMAQGFLSTNNALVQMNPQLQTFIDKIVAAANSEEKLTIQGKLNNEYLETRSQLLLAEVNNASADDILNKRNKENALLAESLKLLKDKVDLDSADAQRILANVAATSQLNQQTSATKANYEELSSASGSAFEKITDGVSDILTGMKSQNEHISTSVQLTKLWLSVQQDLTKEMLKLAVINPIKNQLFGKPGEAGLPTFGSVVQTALGRGGNSNQVGNTTGIPGVTTNDEATMIKNLAALQINADGSMNIAASGALQSALVAQQSGKSLDNPYDALKDAGGALSPFGGALSTGDFKEFYDAAGFNKDSGSTSGLAKLLSSAGGSLESGASSLYNKLPDSVTAPLNSLGSSISKNVLSPVGSFLGIGGSAANTASSASGTAALTTAATSLTTASTTLTTSGTTLTTSGTALSSAAAALTSAATALSASGGGGGGGGSIPGLSSLGGMGGLGDLGGGGLSSIDAIGSGSGDAGMLGMGFSADDLGMGAMFGGSAAAGAAGSGAAAGAGSMGFADIMGSLAEALPMLFAARQGAVFGYAKGGMPSLHDFANRIVSRPTNFKFADGVGMMGEAGPEGILPLARTRDGSLGVRAGGAGGQSGPTPVTVINNNSSQIDVNNRRNSSGGSSLEIAVSNQIAKDFRTGGPASTAARDVFGSRVQPSTQR